MAVSIAGAGMWSGVAGRGILCTQRVGLHPIVWKGLDPLVQPGPVCEIERARDRLKLSLDSLSGAKPP